jgi:hypothetical protein
MSLNIGTAPIRLHNLIVKVFIHIRMRYLVVYLSGVKSILGIIFECDLCILLCNIKSLDRSGLTPDQFLMLVVLSE